MKKSVFFAASLAITALAAVPALSLAQSGGSIGADDAQRASKALTKMFGQYDGAHRCWPVAAQGSAPAACLTLVQAIGVDASEGTQLHVLLGGAGVAEMVTLAQAATPDRWTVMARSAPIATGVGDAPADAKDLRFQKLGQDSWGWVGRGGAARKFVVYAAQGDEIVASAGIAPSGSAGATLVADTADPTKPHYPLGMASAATPAHGAISTSSETWRYDETAKNYVPVPRSRDAQFAAAKPVVSPPRAVEPQRFASAELPDAGVATASADVPPVIVPGESRPGISPPPVAASPVVTASSDRPEPVAERDSRVAPRHVHEPRVAAHHVHEPIRIARAASRHHVNHAEVRTARTNPHRRARIHLAQLHAPSHHAMTIRRGGRSTERADLGSAPYDVTDLMLPTAITIAEMTEPAIVLMVNDGAIDASDLAAVRTREWSDFSDASASPAIWSWTTVETA